MIATLLAASAAVPVQAGARQEATVLMSENPRAREFQENWGFSDAVIAGDTIYLSGIVAGRRPEDKDLGPAYERVYRQIETILKRAGASWDDVVDMSSFHTDVDGQIESMVAVHKKYVKRPTPPGPRSASPRSSATESLKSRSPPSGPQPRPTDRRTRPCGATI